MMYPSACYCCTAPNWKMSDQLTPNIQLEAVEDYYYVTLVEIEV